MDYTLQELKMLHDGVANLWSCGSVQAEALGLKLVALRRKLVAHIQAKEAALKAAQEAQKSDDAPAA
jgi:hypothetical protein